MRLLRADAAAPPECGLAHRACDTGDSVDAPTAVQLVSAGELSVMIAHRSFSRGGLLVAALAVALSATVSWCGNGSQRRAIHHSCG